MSRVEHGLSSAFYTHQDSILGFCLNNKGIGHSSGHDRASNESRTGLSAYGMEALN